MSIYQNIFNLLETYIFGTITAGSYEELVCILASTVACIYLAALPFVLVWNFTKMLRW